MKSAIFTALISLFGLSIFMLIAGTLTTNLFMTALKTPQYIFADSALYLNVYPVFTSISFYIFFIKKNTSIVSCLSLSYDY